MRLQRNKEASNTARVEDFRRHGAWNGFMDVILEKIVHTAPYLTRCVRWVDLFTISNNRGEIVLFHAL